MYLGLPIYDKFGIFSGIIILQNICFRRKNGKNKKINNIEI